jgi:hypothetical protein
MSILIKHYKILQLLPLTNITLFPMIPYKNFHDLYIQCLPSQPDKDRCNAIYALACHFVAICMPAGVSNN